ncbi:hypothetical protein GIW70_19600 [Pseudomonas syringae]|nr:hypothetical protein [Pseudomonas syringae]MCF5070398.1 hypothetical protein [Pseudomonas syringae]
MTWRFSLPNWRFWVWLVLCSGLALAAARQLTQPLWDDPMIALEIGGTYESMRERSTAPFSPLIRGHVWGGIPKTDARLRLVDPQYGFETPLARFLSVGFNDNVVNNVRMSPQIEPLLIDDAMKVVVDLQAQWCAKGWKPMGTRDDPTIADTPEWRAYVRQGVLAGHSFWQAGDKYQVMLILARFRDYRHPDQERYLITLEVADAWRSFDETADIPYEPHHFPPPQPQKGATPCPSRPS